MVKANRQQIRSALKGLDSKFRGVLAFGPDEGLVRERADMLARQLVEDPSDPFRVARLTPETLKADPARLADEMAAISMLGGRRLVRLEGAQDAQAAAIESATAVSGDSLLVATAGELPPRSKLRKLFEQSKHLLTIACYPEEGRDLEAFLRETLEEAGLRASADALDYLAGALGGDRQVLRRELEKLIMYKGSDADRTVTLEDARDCVGDSAARSLAEIAEAVTGGRTGRLDRLLDAAFATGESPVAVLRVVSRRLQQLHLLRGHMAGGAPAAKAAERLTPRLFFKERDAVLRDAEAWTADRLSAALTRLQEAEADCKSTGLPADAICARTCMQLAAAARRTDRLRP